MPAVVKQEVQKPIQRKVLMKKERLMGRLGGVMIKNPAEYEDGVCVTLGETQVTSFSPSLPSERLAGKRITSEQSNRSSAIAKRLSQEFSFIPLHEKEYKEICPLEDEGDELNDLQVRYSHLRAGMEDFLKKQNRTYIESKVAN